MNRVFWMSFPCLYVRKIAYPVAHGRVRKTIRPVSCLRQVNLSMSRCQQNKPFAALRNTIVSAVNHFPACRIPRSIQVAQEPVPGGSAGYLLQPRDVLHDQHIGFESV